MKIFQPITGGGGSGTGTVTSVGLAFQNISTTVLRVDVAGTNPVTVAGTLTGTFQDPGYNGIVGWDDTTNTIRYWQLGTGLAYDSATNTINGSGGASILLQTDGVTNGSQTILNLISGTGITITDDGLGGVTITNSGGSTPTPPAPPDRSIQWNNNGVFGGDSDLLWTVGESVTVGTATATATHSLGLGDVNDSGVVSADSNDSIVFGFADGVGSSITSNGGSTAVLAFGYASTGGKIFAGSDGSFVQGTAASGGRIETGSDGAFAGGQVIGLGSLIQGSSTGSMARGYVTDGGQIISNSGGSNALGFASGTVITFTPTVGDLDTSGTLTNITQGSTATITGGVGGSKLNLTLLSSTAWFAFDTIEDSSGNQATVDGFFQSTLITGSAGAFAFGAVTGGGLINSTSDGAIAGGHATGLGIIRSSADGSVAFGLVDGENSIISSENAGAFIHGNVESGSTIRVSGTAGTAFGQAKNGSMIDAAEAATVFGHVENGGTLGGTTGQGSLTSGRVDGDGGVIRAPGEGATAIGSMHGVGLIESSGGGSFAGGNSDSEGEINANSNGSLAFGNSSNTNSLILSAGSGSTALGDAVDGGLIRAFGDGSIAFGRAVNGGSIQTNDNGAFVGGFADAGNSNQASGLASFAFGQNVTASNVISVAIGTDIISNGSNAFALGSGITNNTNDSFDLGWGQLDFHVEASQVKIPYLGGGGLQMVTADNDGILGVQAIPGGGGGITWFEITVDSAAAVDSGYITNDTALITVTLPATAALGSILEITGKGTGGWLLAQNASQLVHFGADTTTTGTGGSLASTLQFDSIRLVCITANTTWNVLSAVGNLTVV